MEVIMMSNKFILPLQKNFEIPVIRLNEPFDLTVAFNSSVLLPIWTLKESLLLDRRHVHFECFRKRCLLWLQETTEFGIF